MEKKKPEIRFNGFEEEWVRHSLNYYLTVSSEKNQEGQYSKYDIYSVSREYGVINQIEYQGKSFAGASLLNYGVVQTEDIVYTKSPLKSQPYGIIKVNSGKSGLVSALYGVFHPQEPVCSYFVQIYFDLDHRLNSYLRPLVNKGAKNTLLISDADALQGEVIFPSRDEQEKLVSFFTTLDKLIVKLEAKLDKLRKLKQALLEKMFANVNGGGYETPEIRFKGYTDKWEVKELREVAEFAKGKGYSKGDLTKEGIPIIRYGSLYTDYRTEIDSVSEYVQYSEGAIFSRGGEVIIPASGETSEDIARASAIKLPSVIIGGDLNIIYPNAEIDTVFLALEITYGKSHTYLAMKAQGASVVHLRKLDISTLSPKFPSLSEQEQIGKCFTQIDTHFSKTSTKLTKLRNIKQSLLQKMFA